MDVKRKLENTSMVPMKRPKTDIALINKKDVLPSELNRTTGLHSPIMLLTGHEGEIYAVRFSPSGEILASAGFERNIFLWTTYGECENYALLKGHKGAVMQIAFSADGSNIVTASTDKTLALWDCESGTRIKRFKGHRSFVNACETSRRSLPLVCSGSDDGSIRIWDVRSKNPAHIFDNKYQVTAVSFTDTSDQLISGGLDNTLKVWDIRKGEVAYEMVGHTDTVTGIRLSNDGSYIVSNAMDNTVRIWDVRPYAPKERCVKIFLGAKHSFEKNLLRSSWSCDGSMVTAGSADRNVYIWDTTTRRIVYKLPGHAGSVNDVDFHPQENIVASASSDKRIYLGEIH